jgi:hypothetical protein
MDVKLLQLEKAPSPIDVTPSGIVTDVKLLQPEKAPSPIDVTPSGIVTDVKPMQLWKAPRLIWSIDVTRLPP